MTIPDDTNEPRRYRFRTAWYDSRYYGGDLFINPERILEEYDEVKNTIPDYDTIVGTGLSGSIAAGILAVHTGKMYAVVRKEGAITHSRKRIEGMVGRRWLFVDDFIDSGRTLNRVTDAMKYDVPDTTFIGSWLYDRGGFEPAPKPTPEPTTTSKVESKFTVLGTDIVEDYFRRVKAGTGVSSPGASLIGRAMSTDVKVTWTESNREIGL
jgi:hypothetical protein